MTINRRIKAPIAEARPGFLSSHRRVAQEAAANCMDGWPIAGSWEQKATTEGRWIEGDPAYFARRDSMDQAAYNFELGAVTFGPAATASRMDSLQLGPTTICSDFACAIYPEAPARRADSSRPAVRVDEGMSERVAAAAVTVVRRLSALARALPGMGPRERAQAEAEIAASSAALQAAGVEFG